MEKINSLVYGSVQKTIKGVPTQMTNKIRAVLGVDIGGSSVKIGYVTETKVEKILGKIESGSLSPIEVLKNVLNYVKNQKECNDLLFEGVGVGFPGQVFEGKILSAPNLSEWKGMDIAHFFQSNGFRFVEIENDANLAAYYEFTQSCEDKGGVLVLITLGTGVGCGLVFDGNIYSGKSGFAGEIGHIQVVKDGALCGCGKKGCLEQYFSVNGLKRLGNEVYNMNISDSSIIMEQINKGDLKFVELFHKGFEYFAPVLASVATLLNPSHIVLGGGMSYNEQIFKNELEKTQFLERMHHSGIPLTQVKLSKAKNDAGALGAALWAIKKGLFS